MGLREFLSRREYQSNKEDYSAGDSWQDTIKAELLSLETEIAAQDRQIRQINAAEEKYKETGDIETLILFWENIWKNGGLLFNGSLKTFRLPDLYIQQKRYADALEIVERIRQAGQYTEKANNYAQKIQKLMKKGGIQ